MSDLAYRHAWNTGFEQRFAELGMTKDASTWRALLKGVTGSGKGSTAVPKPGPAPAPGSMDYESILGKMPAGANATGNVAGKLGWQIPTREGFGATPANYLSKQLWNDRSNLQRAGIIGGGAQAASLHVKARGAQGMYDRFEDEHPILAGMGRLFGVKRPGYFQSMGNPLNPLGIF